MSVSAFGFAFVLTRLDAARANVVFRWASLVAGALGLATAGLGLLLLVNPFFSGTPVEGGLVINALPNRRSHPTILLRESYRADGKVKKRTIANLTGWPEALVEDLRTLLRGAARGGADDQPVAA